MSRPSCHRHPTSRQSTTSAGGGGAGAGAKGSFSGAASPSSSSSRRSSSSLRTGSRAVAGDFSDDDKTPSDLLPLVVKQQRDRELELGNMVVKQAARIVQLEREVESAHEKIVKLGDEIDRLKRTLMTIKAGGR